MLRSTIRVFLLVLNIIAVLLYLLSCLSTVANPVNFWWISLLGVFYPYLLILNLLIIAFWLILLHRFFLISAITLVATFTFVQRIIPLNIPTGKEIPESAVKVMTYNVRVFDLYNWSKNSQSKNKMIDLMESENAGILCVQEFFTKEGGEWNMLEHISRQLNYPHRYFEVTTTQRQSERWGIVTYSKYPIVARGKIEFSNSTNNIAIYTDLKIGDELVRVYNIHLQSNHLANKEHKLLDSFTTETDAEMTGLKAIIKKLKKGGEKRKHQVDLLERHIEASPHKVIVCGDFNDTPVSYAYEHLKGGLDDAFVEEGTGIGQTLVGPIPMLRIDFILLDETLEIYGYKTIKKPYSDHYPAIAWFGIDAN